jgi:hypothetical protein
MAIKKTVAQLAEELDVAQHALNAQSTLLSEQSATIQSLQSQLQTICTQLDAHDDMIIRHEKFTDWVKANRTNTTAAKPSAAQPAAKQPQAQKPAAQPQQPQKREPFWKRRGNKAQNNAAPSQDGEIHLSWADYKVYMDAVREHCINTKQSLGVKGYGEAKFTPLNELLQTIGA